MTSDFFGGNFSPSCEKEFWKRNILSQIPCGFEKKCNNRLKCERAFKIFLFSYFEYCKNWLNIRIDGHHLSNMEFF